MNCERGIAIVTLVLVVCVGHTCLGFNCKFPNEGCERDEDCCSRKCVDAHPGTNARCTKLGLHKPCLYTYQCEDRLRCGNNSCCAKYWGICKHARDCCDKTHHCYEVDDFYYKRCLMAPSLGIALSSCLQVHFYIVCFLVASLATLAPSYMCGTRSH
ncbi:hypothetical protein EGW08_007843 [Elysia chlorotica]|uniref:Granulins domain-containing protein n=1 Tax=Elysia chlorotica TaxID=188477 RepID=A0A433TS73_ELYCH|nr:hypothetical protein EGW08_007843 [Elysia chlorotica]